MIDTDVDTEYLAAFGREHGIAALLDHLGLDEFGNEVSRHRRALKAIAHNDGGWCGDKAREALHP